MRLKFGRYDYAGFAAMTAYACCSLVLPVVLVVMARQLHFPLEAGGMSSGGRLHLVRSLAMVVSLLGSAAVAARLGKRLTMGAAMLLMGLGIFCCGLAPAYAFLLPFVLLAGLGEGLCEALATPFVHDLHRNGGFAENYVSIAHSFWSVGTGLVVLVAGALLTLGVNWRIIVAGVGVGCLATSLGFIWRENPRRRYPERREDNTGLWPKTRRIARSGRFWIYCLGMFLGAGAEFSLTFWTASFVQLHFGTAPWAGGVATACLALGMFVGRYSCGRFVPPGGAARLLLATGLAGIPVTLLLPALSPEAFAHEGTALAVFFVLMFLAGLCVAPFWPSLQSYGVEQLPELDSTLLFIYFSSIGIPGCGFYTWLMGVAGDHFGLRLTYLIIPATLVAFSLVILLEAFVWPRKGVRQRRLPS